MSAIAPEPALPVHPQTAFLVVGFLYVALPVVAWTILRDRHTRSAVLLWCLGTVMYGVAFMLIGLRGLIAPWISIGLANPMAFAAWGLMGAALRIELGAALSPWRATAMWAVACAAFVALVVTGAPDGARVLLATFLYLAGATWVCAMARRLYRREGYRSAAFLSWAYAAFALMLGVRLVMVSLHWRDLQVMAPSIDFALVFVSGLVAALYGNLGYIGIALESSRIREIAGAAALAREHERRMQTEAHAQEQVALLAEREQLLAQREEFLLALAHEVRQPLNNASAALQSAEAVIAGPPQDRERASGSLRRASTVLAHVMSAVDNTLTDAVLLSGSQAIEQQDSDVETLVQLVQGDLPMDERGRVVIERETPTRTASMHPGLMRIALRNLLLNALKYAPPGTPVTLRIRDSDEPLGLEIDVIDRGPGLPGDLMPQLFTRGARSHEADHRRGHGLGLYLVRRIMELHQGSVAVAHTSTGGTTFRLLIPQGR
jgi:signal transduction histidine kinase